MKNIVFCADGTWNGSSRDEDGDGMTTLPWIIVSCFLMPALFVVHIVTVSRLLTTGRGRAGGQLVVA